MKLSEIIDVVPSANVQADIEPLLAPVPGDASCGPNLEDDRAFMSLEIAAQGRPERSIGDDTIPAEPPNWVDVKARAEALLARTKDLRIAMLWLRAATALDGLAGFEAGLHLLRELSVRFWGTMHPAPEPDASEPGGFDLGYRRNVLAELAAPAFMCALRDMPVVQWRGATPTLREIEQAQREALPVTEVAVQRKQLDEAVEKTAPGLEIALRLPGVVRALEAALDERFGMQPSPMIEPLLGLVDALAKAVGDALARAADQAVANASKALGAPSETVSEMVSEAPPADGLVKVADHAPARATHPANAALASRADAIAWLDAVSAFLERTEPAHPAPLLIRRASALLAMDFIGVMRELAPESLNQIYAIAGLRPQTQTQT